MVSLDGVWELKLGKYEGDDEEYHDSCILPGTLDENKKGNKNTEVTINRLNRKYIYTGPAVYRRKIYIPSNLKDRTVSLKLERTKITKVFVNGVEQTNCNSNNTLGTPQVYELADLVPGSENTLSVQVTNDAYPVDTTSHMLTEETVTNWNGIIGTIELETKEKTSLEEVRIYPDIHNYLAKVKLTIENKENVREYAEVEISAESYNHTGIKHQPARQKYRVFLTGEPRQETAVDFIMGKDMKVWSEFEPVLYNMTVTFCLSGMKKCEKRQSFGMREFSYVERKFTINGRKIFLRGEVNSAVFPVTGYSYMSVEEWKAYFQKARELGINFFRFHSWIPPEAAFQAADEMGIYMQPELYGFGGTPFMPDGNDTSASDYYQAEAVRILRTYANHPSFVMMSWGNELNTSSAESRKYADLLREKCRSIDNTRLYAEGSNNNFWEPSFNEGDDYWTTCKTHSTAQKDQIRISFSWTDDSQGGMIETLEPDTIYNYDTALRGYTKPIMNHEAGQYQVMPYFDKEIPRYNDGIFEAANLKYYRDLMKTKGLLYMNEKFSKVSARLSAIAYRADIETALRSRDLAGFQLLSIQDFPGQGTAHVGILDNFMEEKEGGFTKEQYRSFNNETVVLGIMPQRIYTNHQTLTAGVKVVNYGPAKIPDADIYWNLKKGEELLKSGTLESKTVIQGGITEMGYIDTGLSMIKGPAKLTVEVGSYKIKNKNCYDIWLYPETLSTVIPDGITVADEFDSEIKNILEAGGNVLLLPKLNKKVLPESTGVRWTTDYWSKMFHKSDDDAHTMGMYIRNEHFIFRHFPTDFFNDYQWFRLMKGSRALILDNLPKDIEPLAWNIDHMEWGRKLGSMFEANVGKGKIVVCTLNMRNHIQEYPEARQLYRSILDYMSSSEFTPEADLTIQDLESIVKYFPKKTFHDNK